MKKNLLLVLFVGFALNAQDYAVQSIGFAPPNSFLEAVETVYVDDGFSSIIPMEFDFEFYGNTYNEIIGSGNGVLSFNVNLANSYQDYVIDDDFSLPSNADATVLNAIMLWHDMFINSSHELPTSLIGFSTIGAPPNRRFVANYNDISHFSSSNPAVYSTFQIVLYETSNIIEFYIKKKPIHTSWNNGNAILGIQNEDGSRGLTAPNYNSVQWEAINEAWRFVPYNANYVEAFPSAITVCNSGSQSDTFNLTMVDEIVSGYRTDTTVTYHLTEEDALSNSNTISADAFETSPTMVHARVEETASGLIDVSIVSLDIVICSEDEDTDGVTNQDEDLNQNGNLADDDTDNDGIPNYLDEDDDNDSIPTYIELNSQEDRTQEIIDTDGDGIENYLDNNDDDDALLTSNEDYNQNGNYMDDDQNNNGVPDYLDNEVESLGTQQFTFVGDTFTIYPNPTKNKLYIKNLSLQIIDQLDIYSTSGKLLKSIESPSENGIYVGDLAEGQYFIKIKSNKSIETHAFLKK